MFEVSTYEDLKKVGTGADGWNLDSDYKLMNDIDASDSETENEDPENPGTYFGFDPIGDSVDNFTGTFDGQGFKITGLYINRTSDYVGLFGYCSGANLENITLESVDITGGYRTGALVGLVGFSTRGKVDECISSGSVTSASSQIGGLIGSTSGAMAITNSSSSATVQGSIRVGGFAGQAWTDTSISDCYATGNVTGTGSAGNWMLVGGFIGLTNETAIEDCYSEGSVESQIDEDRTGGFVGASQGDTITNCYATGAVSSSGSYVGGFMGVTTDRASGSISGCYATGETEGDNRVGGFIGDPFGNILSKCYATGNVSGTWLIGGFAGQVEGEIKNCYSTGNATGTGQKVGGFTGDVYDTVEECYATGNAEGDYWVGGFSGYFYGTGSYPDALIKNCYSTGSATGNSHIGGFCGRNYQGAIHYSYSTGKPSGTDDVGGFLGSAGSGGIYSVKGNLFDYQTAENETEIGATKKTTSEMKTRTTFYDEDWVIAAENAYDDDRPWGIGSLDNVLINEGYPFLMAFQEEPTWADEFILTIEGSHIQNQIIDRSFVKQDNINEQRDTLRFRLIDPTFKPEINQEVEMYIDEDKEFGGVIIEVNGSIQDGETMIYDIVCGDYLQFLDKKLILEKYEDKTINYIIEDLKSEYATDFTTNNVNADITIKTMVFNRVPFSEALNKMAEAVNYSWYIDYDKDIHFFDRNENSAPFMITDTNGNYIRNSLYIKNDLSQLRNSVTIRGDNEEGEERTETYTGDGDQITFPLINRFSQKPTVDVASTSKVVGTDYLTDEDDADCFWDYNEKYIRFKESTKPADGEKVEITGIPLFPIIVRVKNYDSINTYGEYEFFKKDETIKSREEGLKYALAELEAYSAGIIEGSFETDTPGLRSGQIIRIRSNKLDIDEDFLIQKVNFRLMGRGKGLWSVDLATMRTIGIIKVLQSLIKHKEVREYDPETLLTYIDLDDSCGSLDSLGTPSTTQTKNYVYVNGEDPGDQDGVYNFSTYGD